MPPRRRAHADIEVEAREANSTQQLVDILLGVLQGRQVNQPNETITPHNTLFKDFKVVGPPEFKGSAEPIEAQTWVTELEKVFLVTNVHEDQKTVFATFLLKEEANHWWEANKTRAGEGIIAWNKFKELFFENYFPQTMQDRMEVRFLELKQGELTVSQYTAKFNELARFAPHQVSTEARKTRRFEEGLKPQIRSKLTVFQVKTFAEILEKAIIAENDNEALIKFLKDKKNSNEGKYNEEGSAGRSYNNNKRKWNNNNEGENRGNIETCQTCGKNHIGVCLKAKRVCYNCGQEGHFSNNCPSPKKNGCYTCRSPNHDAKDCPRKQSKLSLKNQEAP